MPFQPAGRVGACARERSRHDARRTQNTQNMQNAGLQTVLSVEHVERLASPIASQCPYWVHPAAMSPGDRHQSNCLWGGYSRARAPWVSQLRARRDRQDFFGRASSMLALEVSLAGADRGASAASIGPNRRDAESMTYARRSGDVARAVVARSGQALEPAPFFEPRPLIANLTTGAAREAEGEGPWPAPSWARRGGFPLSRSRVCPYLRRAAAAWGPRNFRSALRPPDCDPDSGQMGRIQFQQTGSGVDAARVGVDSEAQRAESGFRQAGWGDPGDHLSLDAGRTANLRLRGNRVNGDTQGRLIRLARPSAVGHRSGPRGVQRASRLARGLRHAAAPVGIGL